MLERTKKQIQTFAGRIGGPVKLMEVCGTHTMAAFRSGLRSLLPEEVTLLSGPGCPVCVTPMEYIDYANRLAQESGVTVATFGDMLRVPGTQSSLELIRAQGGRVKVVYSPTDALEIAKDHPGQEVVFLGVGFETTAPTVAWTIQEAAARGIENYSVYCAHKTMPQAMAALLQSGELKIDGFLCPGHVSVITGTQIYEFIARDHNVPCVVAGFEALDVLQAVAMLLQQIAEKQAQVENQYQRSVNEKGNLPAQRLLAEIFEASDAAWRGLGVIPGSGLAMREKYAAFDAEKKFELFKTTVRSAEPRGCRCGEVLRGVCTPFECPLFKKTCSPSNPVGACMVSSEGTCAAYFKYAQGREGVL